MTNPTPSPLPKSGEPIVSELDDAIDLLTDDKYRPPEITDARFLVLKAARRVANGTKEWLCQYPEFNDEACVVDHDPTQTRQPRKHLECGWFITIPAVLGVMREDVR